MRVGLSVFASSSPGWLHTALDADEVTRSVLAREPSAPVRMRPVKAAAAAGRRTGLEGLDGAQIQGPVGGGPPKAPQAESTKNALLTELAERH